MSSSMGLRVAGGVALVFGALTLFSGGAALFGGKDMGAVVHFVLWFNFLAGFAYMVAGWGLWAGRRYARPLSLAVFLASLGVGAALAFHIAGGGAYEMRTLGAMSLRILIWAVLALVALRVLPRG
ncbi:hypothetical protein LZA78_03935 [Sinirhodobacter sp. WL0062]|uniref:DUF4175 domain-containing protein n=1 Tax=Rhodobacter flavimaris TaxID=2907145 RepID=A0ABS8YTN2_9RHOB|nr:hypothetical protein [Sinirhodobacter sp. WL0062]MCE5972625.1 hypothetical protein [Sinirhodobacter sp. WL0062]